jgi:hypothetical protein
VKFAAPPIRAKPNERARNNRRIHNRLDYNEKRR